MKDPSYKPYIWQTAMLGSLLWLIIGIGYLILKAVRSIELILFTY